MPIPISKTDSTMWPYSRPTLEYELQRRLNSSVNLACVVEYICVRELGEHWLSTLGKKNRHT